MVRSIWRCLSESEDGFEPDQDCCHPGCQGLHSPDLGLRLNCCGNSHEIHRLILYCPLATPAPPPLELHLHSWYLLWCTPQAPLAPGLLSQRRLLTGFSSLLECSQVGFSVTMGFEILPPWCYTAQFNSIVFLKGPCGFSPISRTTKQGISLKEYCQCRTQ